MSNKEYRDVLPGEVFEIQNEKWLKIQGEVFRETDIISSGPFDCINEHGVCATFDSGTLVKLVGKLSILQTSAGAS